MDSDYDYSAIKEAGHISYEALKYAKGVVKEGASVLEAAERIEKFIMEKGALMAFPVNISINKNAAHYTPKFGDTLRFSEGDVVKIDVGARKREYLGDCAETVDLSGEWADLVEACEEALEAAISLVKAGREVRDIGREIENIAKKRGIAPIKNLGGHGVERDDLHASVFIPNFDNGDSTRLEEGQVIAIEPFMTNGSGYVSDGEDVEIFQKNGNANSRLADTREISAFIDESYSTYPFATRWLVDKFGAASEFKVRRALNDFARLGILESFPVLVERKGGMVAQAEKEMVVQKDSCEVITA